MDETLDQSQPQGGLSQAAVSQVSTPVTFKPGGKGQLASLSTGQTMLDPMSSKSILENMQKMSDELNDPLEKAQLGLRKMSAWTQYNKEPALASVYADEQQRQNNLYSIAQQMEAARAGQRSAGNQQAALAQQIQNIRNSGGRGGLTGGYNEDILNRAEQLNSMGQFDAAGKLLSPHLLDISKINRTAELNPQTYGKAIQTPNGFMSVEQKLTMPQVRAGIQANADQVTPSQAKSAIFGQESSSGRADTSTPNAAGVQGPMQIKDTTFKQYQDMGVIPKDYKIDNPTQNKAAGDMIVDFLHNKYGGNINKIAAEYYGGPGAINTSGAINAGNQPNQTLFPGSPNVGKYVQEVKGRIGTPATQISNIDRPMTAEEIARPKSVEAQATEYGKGIGKEESAMASKLTANGQDAVERYIRHDNSIKLLEDPEVKQMVGYLQNSSTGSAILRQISDGVKAGNYTIGVNKLSENLATHNASEGAINKFKQLDRNFAANAAEYAKQYLKGEGSVSDNERLLVDRVVGSTNDPAAVLKIVSATMRERAAFDKAANEAFINYKKVNGRSASPGEFIDNDPAYRAVLNTHNNELARILNIDPSELKANIGVNVKQTGNESPVLNTGKNTYRIIKQ